MNLKFNGIVLLISLIFCSCKSKEEQNIDKLTLAIKQNIEDQAFKMNQKVTLLEISNVTYTKVGQSCIDSQHLIRNYLKINKFKKIVDLYNAELKDESQLNSLYATYFTNSEETNTLDSAQSYYDSIMYYFHQDTLIQNKIAEEDNVNEVKDFFKTKFFIKGTAVPQFGDTTKGENILDTLIFYFNEKYQPIIFNKP